jgi:Ethanolamine utilization protein EutJ (predicted chaperonin)
MRRLILASYDKIMLKIKAVIMLHKRGEPAMHNLTIGMDLGDTKHVITILDENGVIAKSCSLDNVRAVSSSFSRNTKEARWLSRQELTRLGSAEKSKRLVVMFLWAIHANSGQSGTVMTRQMCMIRKC